MLFSRLFFALVALVTYSYCATYTNPLKNPNGSDPFIVVTGGCYYLLTTTWTDIEITRATTINGLKSGAKKTVWTDSNSNRCCNVWAPEVGGSWYMYYTAGGSATLDDQRVHVLKGGATPWDSYSYVGQMTPSWGIDATVARFTTSNYLVWSCQSSAGQALCIAKMNNPPTSMGASSIISTPGAAWEDVGAKVYEGPAAMYHGGKTYLTYSTSYCWTSSYQLALLTWNGGDPLKSSSWSKVGPVFSSANGNYGTGHHGFLQSPDNSEIWMIYHATSNSGGACDGNRYTMAQKVNWDSDGAPNFGKAPSLSTTLQGPLIRRVSYSKLYSLNAKKPSESPTSRYARSAQGFTR